MRELAESTGQAGKPWANSKHKSDNRLRSPLGRGFRKLEEKLGKQFKILARDLGNR